MVDLEDLLEDITVYLELEKGRNQDYWRDITTITEDQLAQARRLQPSSFGKIINTLTIKLLRLLCYVP